jgi:hypothetical protein
MNTKRASQILSSLVQGIDPISGADLAPNSVLQDADVLRALLAGVAALKEQTDRTARKMNRPANVGNPWTADEERQLTDAFHAGQTIDGIGSALGRTARAIEARLERLGLISGEKAGLSFLRAK